VLDVGYCTKITRSGATLILFKNGNRQSGICAFLNILLQKRKNIKELADGADRCRRKVCLISPLIRPFLPAAM